MELRSIAIPLADVKSAADGSSRLASQALYGETVEVLDDIGAYARIRQSSDGYEGFVRSADMKSIRAAATHRVAVPGTLCFAAPDIKTPAPIRLTLGAHVTVVSVEGRFAALADGTYAVAAHLMPVNALLPDYVATAETLLAAPYLWGGKSIAGLDCSGLVQLSLSMAGIACPRDSGPQAQTLGHALASDDKPRRGDLFFWPGHVAIAYDDNRLIHANAHHMRVAIEPMTEAVTRIAAAGNPLPVIKRF